MENKLIFPWQWPAAATEMERVAKTALMFQEHLTNLHRSELPIVQHGWLNI